MDDSVTTALYYIAHLMVISTTIIMCFYQLDTGDSKRVHMTFDDNVAALGNDLYSGVLGINYAR